jgi:hypothetical protein
MFNIVKREENCFDFNKVRIGQSGPKPEVDLNTFEMLMAGRLYNHENNQGLCYVWCVFKAVEISTSLNIHQQLIPLFKNIKAARESVRLVDGWCLNTDKLANALSLNKFKWVNWGNFKTQIDVSMYVANKVKSNNFYVLGYTGTHWVLISRYGVLYDSIIRPPEYVYTFKHFQVLKYTQVMQKVKYL